MRRSNVWLVIGLALAAGACGGDSAAGPEPESQFTARVSGDREGQLSGEATVTERLEIAEDLTDPDGRELVVLILQDGTDEAGDTNIFFARQGTALDVGEYPLGDTYLETEGEQRVLATFNEWLDDRRQRLHYARSGVLRVTDSGATRVAGTFEIRLGEWVILEPGAGRQDAADLESGSSDLLVTGTFSATRR